MGLIEMIGQMEQPDNVPVLNINSDIARDIQNRSIKQYGDDPYYQVGRRPLDIYFESVDPRSYLGDNRIGNILSKIRSGQGNNLDFNHYQFIGGNGIDNFGFGDTGMMYEDPKKLKTYAFDTSKYGDIRFDKNIIDQAKNIYAERSKSNNELMKYGVIDNNCQDYVSSIMSIAKEIAGDRGYKQDILTDVPIEDTIN